MAFGQDVIGDAAEFADQAEPGEEFEAVVGEIDLPPVKTLAGGGHEVVVIVVPAFAEGNEGQEPIIFAGVGGGKAALAEDVRERIDGEGTVPQEDGAEEEAPDKQRPGADEPERDAQCDGRDQVVFVEPAEFGKFGEVAYVVEARAVVAVGKNPADVGPPEAEERGRVEVLLQIGIAVMVAMVSGPPENSFLRGGHGHEGDYELEPAAGFEGAVGKIAVIAGGDEEHADFVERESGDEIGPLEREEKDAKRGEVDQAERNERNQVEVGSIGEWDGQGSCNRGHRELLLRGNAASVVQARKRGARAAPKTTISVYGAGMEGSRTARNSCDQCSHCPLVQMDG